MKLALLLAASSPKKQQVTLIFLLFGCQSHSYSQRQMPADEFAFLRKNSLMLKKDAIRSSTPLLLQTPPASHTSPP